MANTEYILTAQQIHKSYGRGEAAVHVLRGLDLAVRGGEFVAIMGPSGCGKTTLLHILGMMTPADDGEILFKGQTVARGDTSLRNKIRQREIGFVFQRFNLLAVLSAMNNVEISLKVRGMSDNGHAKELFEALGVGHVAGRKPSQISIGEQQRVAIIRALAHRPSLLLADEPTGNLDSANAQELLGIFRRLNRESGQTIVMITHSAEAAAYADRIVHMKDGCILE